VPDIVKLDVWRLVRFDLVAAESRTKMIERRGASLHSFIILANSEPSFWPFGMVPPFNFREFHFSSFYSFLNALLTDIADYL